MLIDTRQQVYIDKIFSVPVEYEEISAEVGNTPDEPSLTMMAYKSGQVVYYINYDLLYVMGK